MIQELERVALTDDLPARGLRRGQVGTVVMVYNQGEGYEVEFTDGEGSTLAVVTLLADQVRFFDDGRIRPAPVENAGRLS